MAISKIKQLWIEIEQMRENLYDIVSKKGIKSPETILVSQRLDVLLNKYCYLKNQVT